MSKNKQDKERARFEAGTADSWSTGGYGHTVKLFSKAGKLKISWQDPRLKKSKQKTLFSTDSQELRQRATRYAIFHAEKLRSGELGEDSSAPKRKTLENLTMEDTALLYMQRVPGFHVDLFDCYESQIKAWYRSLPESVRKMETTPEEATICRDVRVFRHLFGACYPDAGELVTPFGRERLVKDIEPADSTKLMGYEISQGRSPRTVANEHDRLSAAFRYVVSQYRKSVGLLYNPIDGRIADRTKANVPPYTPEEIARLLAKAKEWIEIGRMWQVFVAVGISSSGRRRGSILGLTESAHNFKAGTVTWLKRYAKGQAYGQGDQVRPMSAMHRQAVEWAIKHRPNPNGPDAPLLWMTDDPTLPIHENHLAFQWKQLEKAAGVTYIKGRAIHSMRRGVVTLLADSEGDGKTSEFVGMTIATVRGFSYKHVQKETMEQVARSLDGLLPNTEETTTNEAE